MPPGRRFWRRASTPTASRKKSAWSLCRSTDRDSTIINGEWIPNTWAEGLDKLPYPASVREGFKKFKKEMLAIDLKKREAELYNVPFSDFMKGYPAEVKQWWDNYGPSNWGAATEDTAAAVGIDEMQEIGGDTVPDFYTWPGGLGAITKKLAEIMQPKFPDRMQLGATTVAVVPDSNEVQVTYLQGTELKTVAAKTVIMASPKFITRRIVQGLSEKQSDAMHQIRYIPYAVVNLIFDKPVFNKSYDTWCPGNTFTDFIVADWTIRNQPGYKQKYNILTCYTPLSEDDRGYLLTESGTRKKAVSVLTTFKSFSRASMSIRSKCTFTAADILFICRRPDCSPRCSRWCENRWIACSSPTPIPKVPNPPPAKPLWQPDAR